MEYQSVKTQLEQFPKIANDEAAKDWRVHTVLPAKYMPAMGIMGLDLKEVVIIFQRG